MAAFVGRNPWSALADSRSEVSTTEKGTDGRLLSWAITTDLVETSHTATGCFSLRGVELVVRFSRPCESRNDSCRHGGFEDGSALRKMDPLISHTKGATCIRCCYGKKIPADQS